MTIKFLERTPLSKNQIISVAPSIFTTEKKPDLSEKYNFVPTYEVLNAMEDQGWLPVEVQEEGCRIEGGQGFQRHKILFRNFRQELVVGSTVLEIAMYNAHNGLAKFIFLLAPWRVKCCNGMVASEGVFEAIRIRHDSYEATQIIGVCKSIINATPQIAQNIQDMVDISLSPDEQRIFAKSAAQLRFGNPDVADIRDILRVRRSDDAGNSLWHTFNRVQENTTKQGIRYKAEDQNGKPTTRNSRAIKGINSNRELNQALWSLAEGMRKLKRGEELELEAV